MLVIKWTLCDTMHRYGRWGTHCTLMTHTASVNIDSVNSLYSNRAKPGMAWYNVDLHFVGKTPVLPFTNMD